MSASPASISSPATGQRRVTVAGLILALAIIAAYLTSFRGAMAFDDLHAIVNNPTIRDLHRLDFILSPGAGGGPVAGRPLVNLSLALNYAAGGLEPWGYHAVNLAIHVCAALALFGLARRTFSVWTVQLPLDRGPAGAGPSIRGILPAFTLAALWALHPLQTESVTYIIQRAESLCGLFYLLTLYCFVRGFQTVGGALSPDLVREPSGHKAPPTVPSSNTWLTLSFLTCLLGMATKEVMASAPLVVLLYDRTFVAGSWRETWRQRRRFHAILMATWLLLAALVFSAENRGGTAGLGTAVPWWDYALTQAGAIVHYLRLVLWPHPLVFDYGTPVSSLQVAALPLVLIGLLLGATLWALAKKPVLGFLGAAFLLILAPSSSVIPIATQTMAEHRMYLPLAAVLGLLVAGLHRLAGRRALVALLVVAAVSGGLTAARNRVYHSELALWSDTVAHRPENPRAHTNLGVLLAEAGRLDEAVAQFEATLRLEPANAAAHLNLCDTLTTLNRPAEALPHGEAAVRLEPGAASAHHNLARALGQLGRMEEAVTQFEEARQLEPDAADVATGLAGALYTLGNQAAGRRDFDGAIARYRRAVAVAPDHLPAHANLANALLMTGQVEAAITEYREALRLKPGDKRLEENLQQALAMRR